MRTPWPHTTELPSYTFNNYCIYSYQKFKLIPDFLRFSSTAAMNAFSISIATLSRCHRRTTVLDIIFSLVKIVSPFVRYHSFLEKLYVFIKPRQTYKHNMIWYCHINLDLCINPTVITYILNSIFLYSAAEYNNSTIFITINGILYMWQHKQESTPLMAHNNSSENNFLRIYIFLAFISYMFRCICNMCFDRRQKKIIQNNYFLCKNVVLRLAYIYRTYIHKWNWWLIFLMTSHGYPLLSFKRQHKKKRKEEMFISKHDAEWLLSGQARL